MEQAHLTKWTIAAVGADAISAMVCLAVAFLLWKRERPVQSRALVIAALGATAAHLMASTPGVLDPRIVWLVEALRNLVWLAVIRALFAADGRHASLRPVGPVMLALVMAQAMQLPLVFLSELFDRPEADEMILQVSAIFHLLFVIGVLVLVHNLYVGAGPQQRPRLGWIAGALVLGWGYELNAYAVLYMSGSMPDGVAIGRSLVWAVAAVLLWFDGQQQLARSFSPSRSVTFQSLSLLVIALYLFGIFAIDGALARLDMDLGIVSRFGAIVLAVVTGALLASRGLRGWLRERIVRNLFRHRYDYREEWLRLSRTIGGQTLDAAPVEQRAVQALADIVDSHAGVLLVPSEEGGATLAARWHWPTLDVPAQALSTYSLRMIEAGNGVIPLDEIRSPEDSGMDRRIVPEWLLSEPRAWALIPLQVESRLAGVVVLARPAYARRLDWEDFDLLRIVGQQLAAHLSEQWAQQALLEAARFDEFNRRIAFVMHDIKNLASQLGLLVSNAERHIEKPAFRADMLATLRNATGRLEALLGRLSNYGGHGVGVMQSLTPREAAAHALAVEIEAGLVRMGPGGGASLQGDPEALDQVLRHLVRNAIEASGPDAVVEVHFPGTDTQAGIEIADTGCGMSAEFIRSTLFKPFVSTKPDGFGIGAFEARELVRAMGGRLEVQSREGLGSRFIVWLPRMSGDVTDAGASESERKVA